MRVDKEFIGKLTFVGVFIFVVYFAIFLIIDMLVSAGAFEFDFLAPSLYYSTFTNAVIAGVLFLMIILMMRSRDILWVIALGMVFLVSPLRAIFMFNLGTLGGIPLSLVYNITVVGISIFLLYRYGRKYSAHAVGTGFVALFYLYIFFVSIAVPVRDAMVAMYALPPISFDAYLHYGFYDYFTSLYAIALGVMGLKLLYPELKTMGVKERNLTRLNEMVQRGNYANASEFGEVLLGKMHGTELNRVKVLTAYAFYRTDNAKRAYEIIMGVEGEEGLKGDICVALGKYDEAKMHYKLAVDSNPKDYVSMVNIGKIYVDEGDVHEAEAWWSRAMSINSKDPTVWQNLSALEVVRGRHELALNLIKEAEKHVKA